jgi:hypothetical protein
MITLEVPLLWFLLTVQLGKQRPSCHYLIDSIKCCVQHLLCSYLFTAALRACVREDALSYIPFHLSTQAAFVSRAPALLGWIGGRVSGIPHMKYLLLSYVPV